jgi:hypothetical protein
VGRVRARVDGSIFIARERLRLQKEGREQATVLGLVQLRECRGLPANDGEVHGFRTADVAAEARHHTHPDVVTSGDLIGNNHVRLTIGNVQQGCGDAVELDIEVAQLRRSGLP